MKNKMTYGWLFDKIDIKEGDTVLVGSDVTRLAIFCLKNGNKLNLNALIDDLKNMVGTTGTLMFPTYDWDFCSGKCFDYSKSKSKTGKLTNIALERDDFLRTKHPIYSFAVWGKDAEYLYQLNNTSSFGHDSPFEYLLNNHAKMLMLDVDYQNSFTFVHYVEESLNVDYRFLKDFSGEYIDENGIKSQRTYSMNVRDLEKGVITNIRPIGQVIDCDATTYYSVIENIEIRLVDLTSAFEIIKNEIVVNDGRQLYEVYQLQEE